MNFLSFLLDFGLLAVLHGVLDLNFKLCAFVINRLIKWEIEKPSDQFLGLIVMSHWLGDVLVRIRDITVVLPLFFVSLENRVCLSRGVQVAGAAWRVATKIATWVGDLVQRTSDDRTDRVLSGRTIGRSGDVVCGLHRACGDEECGFLGWAIKPRSTICQWFGLKTTATVFFNLASKSVVTVFSGLLSKPVVLVSRFGPQNQ
jgi:hypothetical protein